MTSPSDTIPDQPAPRAKPRKTMVSIAWVYFSFVIEKLSTLATTAILARLLVPEQFGLIATSLLVIGLVSTFRDLGMTDALIYFDDRLEETTNAAFWMYAGLGLTLTAVLALPAPWIAQALGEGSELAQILAVMSLSLAVSALGMTHGAILQKELRFGLRAAVDLATAISKAVLTIGLAWAGWGVWALVSGFLLGAVLRTLLLWLVVPWRPSLAFARDRAMALLDYGKHIVANNIAGSIAVYLDQIMILSVFGKEPLAHYFIAARIPELAIYQIAVVLTTVLFPTISTLKDNREEVRTFVVEATRALSYVIFPMVLGISATAYPLIEVLFGAVWLPSAPFLIVLSLTGLFATALWVLGDGFKAVGRPDVISRITTAEVAVSLPIMTGLVAVFREPLAACFALLFAIIFADALKLVAAKRLLDIRPRELLSACAPAAVASLVMVGAVVIADAFLGAESAVLRLAIEIPLGAAVYCALLWALDGARIRSQISHLLVRHPPAHESIAVDAAAARRG